MTDVRRRTRGWMRVMPIAVLVLLVATACADEAQETGGGGDAGGAGGTVEVTLQEWSIAVEPGTVESGPVTFNVTNEGPDHPHELVVIKTDLDAADLPTTEHGGVDESGEGIEVIGEIEEFDPTETMEGTFDLEPGSYVLVCNVVAVAGEHGMHEDGEDMMEGGEEMEGEHMGMEEMEVHYMLGMRTAFTVT